MKKNLLKWILPLFLIALLLTGCLAKNQKTPDESIPSRGIAPVPGTAEEEGQLPVRQEERGRQSEEYAPAEEGMEDQPLSDDLTLDFTRADWKRINTFLSNFSEVYFVEFDSFEEKMDPEEALKDEYELIRFAYMHYKLNDRSKIKSDDTHYILSRADADNCLNRFFGHTVSAGTKSRTIAGQYQDFTESAEYRNNAYYFEAADGGAFNQFTVVNYVSKTPRDTYYVQFNVYSLDYEIYFDTGLTGSYYQMNAVEAALDERLTFDYSGIAELKDYKIGSNSTYQLVYYEIFGNIEPDPQPQDPAEIETDPAASTEQWLEPQPVSDDLTKDYSREDWKRINTFLSNFSEVFYVEYDVFGERMSMEEAMQDAYEMLKFGYLHLKINDSSKVKSDGSHYIVSRTDMDKCLTRFFGHTVPAATRSRTYATQYGDYTETAEYKNNAYYFPAADGESYNQFTVVNRVMKTASGTYYVEFNVYALDIETFFNTGLTGSYYQMTASEALLDEHLEYQYSGTAEVTDYQSGTYRSYQLVNYRIYRNN